MTISFNENKNPGSSRIKKSSKPILSSSKPDEASKAKKVPTINLAAHKLIQLVIDIISDKGDQANDDTRQLGLYFKESFSKLAIVPSDLITKL